VSVRWRTGADGLPPISTLAASSTRLAICSSDSAQHGGRQLDRQGDPVQARADLWDERGVGIGELEAWPGCHCPLHEERGGGELAHVLGVDGAPRVRVGQWWHRPALLVGGMERFAAGRQDAQVGALRVEVAGEGGAAGQQVLAIVQEEERWRAPHALGDRIQQ
jgi:hypothetical protein